MSALLDEMPLPRLAGFTPAHFEESHGFSTPVLFEALEFQLIGPTLMCPDSYLTSRKDKGSCLICP